MKRRMYLLLLVFYLLNPCKSIALSVNELRESVPAYWLHHYKSQQQDVNIRAPIYIPSVDHLPILKVRLHHLKDGSTNLQYLNHNRLTGFSFINEHNFSERIGRPYKSIVFENIWQTEDDVDYENEFAANQSVSLGNIVEHYRKVFNSILEDAQITAIPNIAWIETPYLNVKPGTYEYEDPAQLGNLTGVGGYSAKYWPAIRNIPVIMGHDLAYEGRCETAIQRRLASQSELNLRYHYSEDLWFFSEIGRAHV